MIWNTLPDSGSELILGDSVRILWVSELVGLVIDGSKGEMEVESWSSLYSPMVLLPISSSLRRGGTRARSNGQKAESGLPRA